MGEQLSFCEQMVAATFEFKFQNVFLQTRLEIQFVRFLCSICRYVGIKLKRFFVLFVDRHE